MDPKILIMMFIPAKVNMADCKPRWGKCGFTSWLSDYSKELPDENTVSAVLWGRGRGLQMTATISKHALKVTSDYSTL